MNPDSGYVPSGPAEQAWLAAYDASAYPRTELTVDVVLLTIRDGDLCVLLVRRRDYPFKDAWALPGGFVNPGESLEDAARRELAEETGLGPDRGHLEQLGTYGDPGRDPRARVVSVVYLGLLPHVDPPQHGSDAADARFWRVADLAEEGMALAFDHDTILADALERAAAKLEYSPVATAFCQEEFTLGELRRIYETVWNTTLNGPNFRRWVLGTPGFVEPVPDADPVVSDVGGRPAALFRAGDARLLHPPMLRPALRAARRAAKARPTPTTPTPGQEPR